MVLDEENRGWSLGNVENSLTEGARDSEADLGGLPGKVEEPFEPILIGDEKDCDHVCPACLKVRRILRDHRPRINSKYVGCTQNGCLLERSPDFGGWFFSDLIVEGWSKKSIDRWRLPLLKVKNIFNFTEEDYP